MRVDALLHPLHPAPVFEPRLHATGRERTATHADLHMATDYTPYEGRELAGWPSTVISAGRVVVDSDGFHDPGPVGRPLHSAELPDQLLT